MPQQGSHARRWTSWLARVDHAERHGSLLVLTGADVRLVWHRAAPPLPPDAGGAPLDRGWELTAGQVGTRTVEPVPLHPATLAMDFSGAAIDTGCNRAGAFWNSTGQGPIRFNFDPALVRTTRRCGAALMRQERALLVGLHRARRATATTDSLVLTGRNSRLVFRRVASPDLRHVRNTEWALEARAIGSVTVPARRIRPVSPRTDLGLSVGLGDIFIDSKCRPLRSGLTTEGAGTIVGHPQHGECEHPTSLDRYLTDLFSHSWRFRVDGDTLYVQGYSGRGLIYRRVAS